MRGIAIFLIASLVAVSAAMAGNNNKYVEYVGEQQNIEALIEARKAKLSKGDIVKYQNQMTSIRRNLYDGINAMDRPTYYAKADEAMKTLKNIRQSVETK